jgi:hypothetical protein
VDQGAGGVGGASDNDPVIRLICIVFAFLAIGAEPALGWGRIALPSPPSEYNDARAWLLQRGYHPLRITGSSLPTRCTNWRPTSQCETPDLPEGACSASITNGTLCNFYWRAPTGRIVVVGTLGEDRARVTSVRWARKWEARDLELLPMRRR